MTQTKLLSPARVVVPKAEDGSDIGFATGEQIEALGAQIEALQADIALVTGLVQDGKLPVLAHPPLVIESPEILVPESVKVNNTEEEKVPVADAAVQAKLTELETKLEAVQTILTDGSQKVTQSGTIMEHYGATVAQRPEATEVPVGAAYMAVNTGDVWQSNGFEWVVL